MRSLSHRASIKHLKSTLTSLRHLLETSLSTKYIAETLDSFEEGTDSIVIHEHMAQRDFDVAGISRRGRTIGFVERDELKAKGVTASLRRFATSDCLNSSDPISSALRVLETGARAWVRASGDVTGIVTRGDLQKAPVRMWLFATVSLLEMQLLRIVREQYRDDLWTPLISDSRRAKANQLLRMKQRHNEAIDLADCLQIADKATIVIKTDGMLAYLGFAEFRKGREAFERIERLRNSLAHSQDIVKGDASNLARVVRETEELLSRCERWSATVRV